MQAVQLMSIVGSLAVAGGAPDTGAVDARDHNGFVRPREFGSGFCRDNNILHVVMPRGDAALHALPCDDATTVAGYTFEAKRSPDVAIVDSFALPPNVDPETPRARAFLDAVTYLHTHAAEFDALPPEQQEAFVQAALEALEALVAEGASASEAELVEPDQIPPVAAESRTIETFVGTIIADHESPETVPRLMDFGRGDERICVEYTAGAATPRLRIEDLDDGDQLVWADATLLVWLVQPRIPVTEDQVQFIPVETL